MLNSKGGLKIFLMQNQKNKQEKEAEFGSDKTAESTFYLTFDSKSVTTHLQST
jgi:hypothetical protein